MEGLYRYDNDNEGRLVPETSGYTDCSGSICVAYERACGLFPGVIEDYQACMGQLVASYERGEAVDESLLRPADIFCFWNGANGSWGHSALYMGDGELWDQSDSWSMGDWDRGPHVRTDDVAGSLWSCGYRSAYTRVDIVRPFPIA